MENKTMEYKLLKNKKGIILTRKPEVLSGDLWLTFSGQPEIGTAEAVFKNSNNNELYRVLADGSCIVPKDFLEVGEISVRVALSPEGRNRNESQIYVCENVSVQLLKSGEHLVCPADYDLPDRTVKTELAIGKILDEITTVKQRLDGLETKLSQLLEGYDID